VDHLVGKRRREREGCSKRDETFVAMNQHAIVMSPCQISHLRVTVGIGLADQNVSDAGRHDRLPCSGPRRLEERHQLRAKSAASEREHLGDEGLGLKGDEQLLKLPSTFGHERGRHRATVRLSQHGKIDAVPNYWGKLNDIYFTLNMPGAGQAAIDQSDAGATRRDRLRDQQGASQMPGA
jgi:hypothetical protein